MKDHYIFLIVLALALLFAFWCHRQMVTQAATAR